MSQLSLTYTDPQGSQKNIDHITQNFTDVKAFLNGSGALGGGNLTAQNTASAFAKDNVEPAFAGWKLAWQVTGAVIASIGAASYYFTQSGGIQGSTVTSALAPAFTWLDSADYAAGSRSTKFRVRATIATNGTAPGVTLTAGLYPVTVGGGSGVVGLTLGSAVTSSQATLTTPAANAATHADSSTFTPPTAGAYTLGFVIDTGTTAANSFGAMNLRLEYQQI